jgi:hypothetical protein
MNTFPSFEDWKQTVLNPADTKWWRFDTPEWYAYYKDKYRICRSFQPERILEIGVRFGYSAYSFLKASEDTGAMLYGIDGSDPKFGGWDEPTMPWTEAHLQVLFPHRFQAFVTDTQIPDFTIRQVLDTTFDFIHIDACHTLEGCTNDLMNVLPHASRVILVDDYLECPGVQIAVDQFCQKYELFLLTGQSLRGEAVILV